MRFDIITIFPDAFSSYLATSILGRAQKTKKIDIHIHDLRKWTTDRHRTVDDRPYGGGPGMVMKVEPWHKALKKIVQKKSRSTRIVLLSAGGSVFTHRRARTFAQKCNRLVLLCGRYEGIDERVKKYVDEELSIGKYVLTGGELAAMVVIDAVSRLLPGVLGKDESSVDESWSDDATGEYAQYTRPEVFRNQRVPKVLLSGNHKRIHQWRLQKRKRR